MVRFNRWSCLVLIAALVGYTASATAQSTAQRGSRSQTITCNSQDNRRQTCRVDRWADAELVRQISDTRCVRNRNWGFQRGAVWVDNGCRATFAEVRGTHGRNETVTCNSENNRRQTCRVGNWRDARLVRQVSDTRCVRNRNWGFQRGAVWVDNGCRGTFAEVRSGSGHQHNADNHPPRGTPWQPGPSWNREISLSCASNDNRYHMCQVDVGARGTVRLRRQDSDVRCVLNRTWGFNRAGVWVSNGCRGQFVVDRRW